MGNLTVGLLAFLIFGAGVVVGACVQSIEFQRNSANGIPFVVNEKVYIAVEQPKVKE